jgi:hypothetical protein
MSGGGAIIVPTIVNSNEADMKKFVIGLVVGVVIAFPLGINFGKDVPLWSNPFAAKPDIVTRAVERVEKTIEQGAEKSKEVIHDATKPLKK